jgi:hypothetical protein
MASLSACVLPIAPEFEDPPAAQNFAPQIVDTVPINGSPVSTTTFRVVFTDPNIADTLWVRWIADFPPHTTNSRLLIERQFPPSQTQTGVPLPQEDEFTVGCVTHSLAKTAQHQIMAIVADRQFRSPEEQIPLDRRLSAVPPDALTNEAHWILNLDCNK